MKTLPIIKKLTDMNPSKRVEILSHQGMTGFFEYHYPELGNEVGVFKKQQQRNLMCEELSLELNEKLQSYGLKPAYLKGITFLNDLYPELGTRFMSDVDIYIQGVDLNELEKIMTSLGYIGISEKRWIGNAHKSEFLLKNSFGEFCFEFHNKLFWHREDPHLTFVNDRLPRLGNEEAFVFLCGHYAFIHSCQKLYWLWDIYLFLKTYGDELDVKKVEALAKHFGFERSMNYCLKLVENAFNLKFSFTKRTLIPVWDNVYFSDHQRSFSYLFLKYFLKDHFSDQWKYQSAFLSK